MTHKVTPHRKMEVRHGRAITKQRWRLIRAYQDKRSFYMERHSIGPHTHWGRYADWANDFERFMICGFGPASKRRSDKRLPGVQVRLAVAENTRHPNGRE